MYPINQFFEQIYHRQQHLLIWLQVPLNSNIYYLLVPTSVTFGVVVFIKRFFPEQQAWSRLLMVLITLTLAGRYWSWRIFASLNFSNSVNGFFSLLFLVVESYWIFRNIFQALLLLNFKDRCQDAEENALAVTSGKFTPSVDIFIPTYNEIASIIRDTVIGCQSIEYNNKKIYILDDTSRQEIKNLAQELGCEYLNRPDNKYAKAGNLNYAIGKTSGELIVVFDADFIPNKYFLNRTVGFFQDKNLGFLQTNQHFYNSDSIAYNLGLSDVLPPSTESYYSYFQLLRDGVECTGCSGSSMVLNRAALEKIGGFVTASLSEDYYTGISLSAQGYKSVYLNEKLSAGLETENMAANLSQRKRWARGTIQGFFIQENPLTIPGLKLIQRITHLEEGLLTWVGDVPRFCLFLMPLIAFFGITPIQASWAEIIYFLLPYYLVYFTSYTWTNRQTQSFLISDINTSIHCVPLMINFFKVIFNPFSEKFTVTPKGILKDRVVFHWNLAFPLIGLLIINLLVFIRSIFVIFSEHNQLQLTIILTIWSAYNIFLISCALSALLDAPRENIYWLKLQKSVNIKSVNHKNLSLLSIMSTEMSESGIKLSLDQAVANKIIDLKNQSVSIEFIEDKIEILGKVCSLETVADSTIIQIMFENINLEQQRYLIETLFCDAKQWQRRKTPEDWVIIWLLSKNAVLQIRKLATINLNS